MASDESKNEDINNSVEKEQSLSIEINLKKSSASLKKIRKIEVLKSNKTLYCESGGYNSLDDLFDMVVDEEILDLLKKPNDSHILAIERQTHIDSNTD